MKKLKWAVYVVIMDDCHTIEGGIMMREMGTGR
jgi:hypothetical protein